MTRVTPIQLSTISFPEGGRYVPIRPLGVITSGDDKKRNGPNAIFGGNGEKREQRISGSVMLLRDTKPDEEGEYVEMIKALWPDHVPEEPEPAAEAQVIEPSQPMGAIPGGEAPMPAAFEYPFED